MSGETNTEEKEHDTSEHGSTEAAKAKPKISKKLLLIILPIIIIIIAAAVYFFLFKSKADHSESTHAPDKEAAPTDVFDKTPNAQKNIYLNLEDFVVDLSSQQAGKSHFLKLSLTLSLAQESDSASINDKLPIIRDNFQLYLRELREADLNSSGGMYNLKEELLIRLNKILYPVQVKDLLFREILIR